MNIINFCTLFDSNYCDKGIVMFNSLLAVEQNFKLFVVAFDKKCEHILKEINSEKIVVVSYDEFEDDVLKQAKENRSRREFLWTCSGYSIKFFIDKYELDSCTYIDADMFFYNSPRTLIDRLYENESDVGIIPHNYSNHYENRYYEKLCGKYCVEFNTFRNTENGRKVLDWWINECIKCCVEKYDGEHFGDQKYIDEFEKKFNGIYIYDDVGAGLAPWNIDKYREGMKGTIVDIEKNAISKLYFYHFHSLNEISANRSNISVFVRAGKHDDSLVYKLYIAYIKKILIIRNSLEGYNIWNDNNRRKVSKCKMIMDFLTCEPNLIFVIRKIYRYLTRRKKDIINIDV